MPLEFISVAEALDLIGKNTDASDPIPVPLLAAAGLVLSENMFAKTDVPPFNQSSMDGYAINYAGWKIHGELNVEGEVAAGASDVTSLDHQIARRIFTGAPIPPGADTVVMQEKVKLEVGKISIQDNKLIKGSNCRAKGSEIKVGSLALKKGSLLTPPAIGYLAGAGIHEVYAYPNPSVTIILTGNELQGPGKPLTYGQVYESNSYALNAALKQAGISSIAFSWCADHLDTLVGVLEKALANSDIVLLTGGVSVGDYDFVRRAAEANGVTQIFHKIRQKPGKPLFFGKKERKIIFGLPGNPASVLSCFYEYVLPCLGKMSRRDITLKRVEAPLKTGLTKPKGLTQFLKGYYDGNYAYDLKAQESFRLSSFAAANCLIKIDEEKTVLIENELVEIHLLPEYYG